MPLFVLMNTETANLVGTYQSELAALVDVAGAARRYGSDAPEVASLSLVREDVNGLGDAAFIAEGSQLVRKALAAVPEPSKERRELGVPLA
jgi:hypothetical protein